MKKFAFAIALALVLQSIPAVLLASSPTPTPSTNGSSSFVPLAAAVGLGLLVLGVFDGHASAKATGTEFEKLNNNPAFPVLLKQMAGGSLDTVEILK